MKIGTFLFLIISVVQNLYHNRSFVYTVCQAESFSWKHYAALLRSFQDDKIVVVIYKS